MGFWPADAEALAILARWGANREREALGKRNGKKPKRKLVIEIEEHAQELDRLIDEQDPYLLTGSPPCTEFGILLNVSKSKLSPKMGEQRKSRARQHLAMAVKKYRKQMQRNRYFLHEHPTCAESWQE